MTLLYIEKMRSVFDYLRQVYFDFWDLHEGLMKFDLFLDLTENKNPHAISCKNFSKISFKNVKFSYPNFVTYELRYLQILEEKIKRFSSKRDRESELAEIVDAKKEISQIMPLILKSVDMEFETGKTYGIVGKNGAGKTTIISLLQKFFENFS